MKVSSFKYSFYLLTKQHKYVMDIFTRSSIPSLFFITWSYPQVHYLSLSYDPHHAKLQTTLGQGPVEHYKDYGLYEISDSTSYRSAGLPSSILDEGPPEK